jgi:hypothetical protein
MSVDRAGLILAATERIKRADTRLVTMLSELAIATRADKSFVTQVVRDALDELAAAREALEALEKSVLDEAKSG